MNQDEALKQAQHEIWDKGTFFQSEMAQYAIQLGFEKGAEWKEQQLIEKAVYKCANMLHRIDDLLRKKGLKGQFEDEFDKEYKIFCAKMKGDYNE